MIIIRGNKLKNSSIIMRIISVSIALFVLSSTLVFPVHASGVAGYLPGSVAPVAGGSIGVQATISGFDDFLIWAAKTGLDGAYNKANALWEKITGASYDVCTSGYSQNGKHNFVLQHTQVGDTTGYFYVCEYCGKSGGEYVDSAYSDYVESLPATGISSDGGLIWTPTIADLDSSSYVCFSTASNAGDDFKLSFPSGSGSAYANSQILRYEFSLSTSGSVSHGENAVYVGDVPNNRNYLGINYFCSYIPPITGKYTRIVSPKFIGSPYNEDWFSWSYDWVEGVSTELTKEGYYNSYGEYSVWCDFYFPTFRVVPTSGVVDTSSDTVYNVDSRAGSITGDYGIVGDNGTISVVENVTIVNEENNTFYNPGTGETLPIESWSYDYSDRSYDLQLGDDVGVKVKFDDAALTLDFSQGDDVEGDVYTYYYVTQYINNSGGEDPEPTASPVPTDEPTPTDTPTPTDAPTPTDDPDNPVVVVIPTPVPVIADVPEGILTLRERLRELYNNLVEMLGDASSFLSDAFSFVPQEIGWLIEFSFALAIVVGIFRMFWK